MRRKSFPNVTSWSVISVLWVGLGSSVAAQQHQNLKVLPADISREDLTDIMLDNLRGLGLPRLAGEGCLFCHEGDLETPRREWDYASDAKPMKEKARVMLAMVRAINEDHLSKLDNRIDETTQVTCMTCHAGRTDPRPLPVVLWDAYTAGGVDSASSRLRVLRRRYYGSDAYDFRVGVLTGVAMRVADEGDIEGAVTLASVNARLNRESRSAREAWVQFRVERAIDAEGVEAALEQLKTIEEELAPVRVSSDVLGDLGWRLKRTDRDAQGNAVLEANFEKFPNLYIPLESMVFVWAESGEQAKAFAALEGWLAEHPDHARARRLLVNLRER